jgi:hypothetical protein
MKPEHMSRQPHEPKRAPLWKWIVILFIVVAMPLFFAVIRQAQLQNVASSMSSSAEQQPSAAQSESEVRK